MLLPWRKRRPRIQKVLITDKSKNISEPRGLREFLERTVCEFDNLPHVKFMETAERYYSNEDRKSVV